MINFTGFYTQKLKSYKNSVNGFLPNHVVIPLMQDGKFECEAIVKPGDKVSEGQLIASLQQDSSKYNSYIYSPVPGVVESIELTLCPNGHYSKGIKIKVGGSFNFLGKKNKATSWNSFSASGLTREIAEKGILNTFTTSKPVLLANQIDYAVKNKSKLLVIRLFDEDPSRISDSLVSKMFFDDVIEGSEITAKSMDAKGIVFVADENFIIPDNFKVSLPSIVVPVNSKAYPVGFPVEICKAVKKFTKDELFASIKKDDLFVDSMTMLEVCKSVKFSKPIIDKYVHVSGECIPSAGFFKVSLGTTLRFLAEQCGGFLKNPSAIVINGLIVGTSASDLDIPITKYVKSVSFLPLKRKPNQIHSECIRCGNCRRVCTMGLSPDILYRHMIGGKPAEPEYLKTAVLCSDCGLCNTVCPSRLSISQLISELKNKIQ